MSMSDFNARNRPSPSSTVQPRSILKNRDRYESTGSTDLDLSLSDGKLMLNQNINSGAPSWMNSSENGSLTIGLNLNPSPVAAPAVGINPASSGGFEPVPPQGLERSLREKLNEFVAMKGEILFRPLSAEEKPIHTKGTYSSADDHYGVVPSLDHYLRVNAEEIRRYFFQNLQVGDVLIASVSSRSNSGLYLKLISTDGGKHIVLEDLSIKCFCPINQTVPARDPKDSSKNYDYETGDYVRVEALSVQADDEKLVCGMKGVTLTPEMQHSFHLGLISRYELPRQFTLAKADGESRSRKSYHDMLISSTGFHNPNNIQHLASTLGILNSKNTLLAGLRNEFPPDESAAYLRRMQNGKWAHGNVADGIKFFKAGKFTEAFGCLNKALSIDAENVEGLVARGALYANNGGFEKAIDDFESALKFNPNHFNARKYLAETLVALGKQQETAGKLEDSVASYSKCLVVKPDHKDAKDALWSLYERTNKLDISKLAGPAALKATELKEKLKAILQSGLGMGIDGGIKNGKIEKEKKSKKKKGRKGGSSGSEDDSSSSSSSDSDSDSSSSEDSDRDKKKRKRSSKKKKNSKKSKKNRKNRDESKNRALSLSPFSKRLVDPQGASGSGLAGFSESTFAEWGQQLGISKTEKKETDDDNESKRSGKKSKDKKRSKKKDKRKKRKRNSSSSSSSGSDSDRDKKKSKNSSINAEPVARGLEGIGIPDLGDLERKLTAYYSKIEQEKIGPVIPPESVKITVERNTSSANQYARDAYNEPVRKIQVQHIGQEETSHNSAAVGGWHESKLGKIELRTDDYGNYIQPENIVRTVQNDQPAVPGKPLKFEMKFKSTAPQSNAPEASKPEASSGSKWRPLGSAPPPGSEEEKRSPVKPKSMAAALGIRNPFEVQKFDTTKDKEQMDRNYRGKRLSRSRSRSPIRRGGRRGVPVRRSRSRSRSRSNSSSSRSGSRSKSRSRSPSFRDRYRDRDRRGSRYDVRDRDRGDRRDRGRPPTRFFRGYNRGVRRPYIPRGGGGSGRGYRPNGPSRSKFRNRFSRSMSRSRSGSRSRRSNSRSLLSRSRSKSKDKERSKDLRETLDAERANEPTLCDKRKEVDISGGEADAFVQDDDTVAATTAAMDNEIQIGSLTTTKASEVEELLDKRNAEKKEELRKSNPDFFRN